MKTDRFDEEFRRKLRGLPQASSPDEVNRIADHVSRNLPPAPGIGWGSLAGYVAGGLVLLGSLLYNVVQYQQTATLQTTVDLLKTAPPALVQQPAPVAPPFTRTDTVYVTRYQSQPESAPILPNQLTARTEEQSTQTTPEVVRNSLENKNLVNSGEPGTGLKLTRKEAVTAIEPATDSTGATTAETIVTNDEPVHSELVRPGISTEPAGSNPLRRTGSTGKHAPNRRDLAQTKTRRSAKLNNPVNDAPAGERTGKLSTDKTATDLAVSTPAGSHPAELVPRTESEKEPADRSGMAVGLLKNKPLTSANLSATISRKPISQPVAVASALPVRKPVQTHSPRVSSIKTQYFGGLGLNVGDEYIGGSLLGEVRLNRHWSLQTGVQLLAQTGFDYQSSDDFGKYEGQDFYALYAPNVAPGNEIRHIHQFYGLVQVPLTVAYHYPLGRAWALRLGVGTNLDLLAHNRITFEYERNGREFEQGISENNTRVSLFNNATVSVGLERQWNRLLLRASPYVSPQLKRVSYKDDAFYWGGQVQVLWQFR